MELSNDRRLIVLSYESTHQKYQVKLESSLERVLKKWSPSTRISPLFGIKRYRNKTFSYPKQNNKNFIIFIGPLAPSRLKEFLPKRCGVWLSLGLFNIVLQTHIVKDKQDIVKWLDTNKIRYELWILDRNKINHIQESKNGNRDDSWRGDVVKIANMKVPLQIEETKNEYCPLIATALGRSSEGYPNALNDLKAVNSLISELLFFSTESSLSEQHETNAVLAKTNAGLSRFSSQTFSGTSPILGTECHYWTHSLLGTGMANIALYQIFLFVRDKLGSFNMPARFENINNCPLLSEPFPLIKISTKDEFWYQDYLNATDEIKGQKSQTVFPLVTYFSGRDGFKSTNTTLSAPLATISSCNSRYWDLMTLTHELSHLTIKGFLTSIYPNRESKSEIQAALSILENKTSKKNWLATIQEYLLQSIILIHKKDIDANLKKIDVLTLGKILNKWYYEIEEIMAHVFDFLYFYRTDVDHYISSIWSSWSVIPNISNRIEEYSIRSVCAVLSNNLRKEHDPEGVARKAVLASLVKLKNKNSQLPYVKDAINFLNDNWDDELRIRIFARRSIVALVRGAFPFSRSCRRHWIVRVCHLFQAAPTPCFIK